VHALVTLVFVVALAVHAKLGMQVIIEDYVHCEAKKLSLLIFNSAAMLLFALLSIFAIARLHFIGI
jgi:succinate dehydrogenase / fumarate reductase membrane anchor subunit